MECEALWPAGPCGPGARCAGGGAGGGAVCECLPGWTRTGEADAAGGEGGAGEAAARAGAPCTTHRGALDAIYGAAFAVAALTAVLIALLMLRKRLRGAKVVTSNLVVGCVACLLVIAVCSIRVGLPDAHFFKDPLLMLGVAALGYAVPLGMSLNLAWALLFLIKTAQYHPQQNEAMLRAVRARLVSSIVLVQAIPMVLLLCTLAVSSPRAKRAVFNACIVLDTLTYIVMQLLSTIILARVVQDIKQTLKTEIMISNEKASLGTEKKAQGERELRVRRALRRMKADKRTFNITSLATIAINLGLMSPLGYAFFPYLVGVRIFGLAMGQLVIIGYAREWNVRAAGVRTQRGGLVHSSGNKQLSTSKTKTLNSSASVHPSPPAAPDGATPALPARSEC